MRIAKRIALAVLSALCMGGASAGTTTFPGATEFTFNGYNNGAGFTGNLLRVCVPSTPCHVAYGDAQLGRVISTSFNQLEAGSAVRGTLESTDPQGTLAYYTMEFDLHTKDFFSENQGAHIIVAPRAFLPFLNSDGSSYHGYPQFLTWPGSSPSLAVPHAYGNGLILGGDTPCNNGLSGSPTPTVAYMTGTSTVAIEHFIGPANTNPASTAPGVSANLTACPVVQTIGGAPTGQVAVTTFNDNAVYSVKVFVKQYTCAATGYTCRTLGYKIQRTSPTTGPLIKGGGDESSFPDTTQGPAWGVPRSWSALQSSDLSSWYLGHIMTKHQGQYDNWEFQVKNLSVSASNSAPGWW